MTTSVIIPSRNERFLYKTIEDVLKHAEGDIEIIPVFDGADQDTSVPDDPRVKPLILKDRRGMRGAINAGVEVAQCEYIMKLDAHCMVDQGFDVKLIAEHQPNWVQVPRRKRLDAENWCIQDVGKPDVDYEYITNPSHSDMSGYRWDQRSIERKDILVDDLMTFQGSCWFMTKAYFYELELMDEDLYGQFYNEAQEISFKAWLSGGECKVNKKTYYAHLHKGRVYGRGYTLSKAERPKASRAMVLWTQDTAWHKQTKPFDWLITHFSPPTWS